MASNLKVLFKSQFKFKSRPVSEHTEPPTVQWLLEHVSERREARALTPGRTPTASLYRMYEYLVVGFNIGLRTEIEFFFNQPAWKVAEIPDPKDADPQRYAILAGLPFYLVKAFNRLIERGLPRGSPAIIAGDAAEQEMQKQPPVLEEEPRWALDMVALPETLVIPTLEGGEPVEAKRSERYQSLNVWVEEPHVFFV